MACSARMLLIWQEWKWCDCTRGLSSAGPWLGIPAPPGGALEEPAPRGFASLHPGLSCAAASRLRIARLFRAERFSHVRFESAVHKSSLDRPAGMPCSYGDPSSPLLA